MTITRICRNPRCGAAFEARQADVNRGWALYCGKSCKAIAQVAGRKGSNQPPAAKKTHRSTKHKRPIEHVEAPDIADLAPVKRVAIQVKPAKARELRPPVYDYQQHQEGWQE